MASTRVKRCLRNDLISCGSLILKYELDFLLIIAAISAEVTTKFRSKKHLPYQNLLERVMSIH